MRSNTVPYTILDSRQFCYFVAYWLYHASSVATEIQQRTAPSKLSVAALGFFRDRSAFESWVATVAGEYIVGQYLIQKSEPLHIAAAYGLLGTAGLLVNGGADISAIDDAGWMPLFHASRQGHEGVVRLLIDKGADVSAASEWGETPLLGASYGGHEGVVRLLIEKGADISAANKEGKTPLYKASYGGHEGVVRLLIDKGADVSTVDNEGIAPLQHASHNRHKAAVVELPIGNSAT